MAISWSRVVMHQEVDLAINSIVSTFDYLDLLEISGERWQLSGNGTYTRVKYPEFDICKMTLDKKFNLVIAEQVFEHLKYPYRAGKNVYEMLHNGGWFLISVPCLYPVHNYPIDCTRWTPLGLQYFLNECGFNIRKTFINSWGNHDCLIVLNENPVDYDKEHHSLRNDPRYPIVVWGVAQK